MGFLQGIIADARSGDSGPAVDGNRPSVVERGGVWNAPSAGGKVFGETGFQESRSELGVFKSGAENSIAYRDPSVFSSTAIEASRSSRPELNTAENVVFVAHHHGSLYPVSPGNVPSDEAGIWKDNSSENGFDFGAESSAVYREPSVFSAPSAKTDDFSRSDAVSSGSVFPSNSYPDRIGRSNQDEMMSESTVAEDEFRRPDIQGIASTPVEEPPTFKRTRSERQTRPLAGSPASTEPVIEPGIAAAITPLGGKESVRPASEREDASTLQYSSSITLPRQEGALIEPLLHEADVRRLSGNRDMKHVVPSVSVAAQAVSVAIPALERGLRPTAHTKSTATMEPSLRPKRQQDERHVKESARGTATVSSISTEHHHFAAKRTGNEGNTGSPRIEAKVHQHETQSLADKKRVAAQAELAIRPTARQDRGWSAGVVTTQPVQRAPEVRIGQVDVFIEAPRKSAVSDRRSPGSQNSLSSRHYLRKI